MIAPRSYSNRRDPSHTAWVPPLLFVVLRRISAAPLTHVAPARAHGCGEHWRLPRPPTAAAWACHRRTPRLQHEGRTRGATPVTSQYTRSVAIHPIRRGVMPTDRVHRLPQQAQPRAIPPHSPLPSASDVATRPRHAHPGSEREALHPLRRDTPVTSRCTRSEGVQCLRIGCAASSVTSLHVGLLAGAGHAGVRQTQAVQRCTQETIENGLRWRPTGPGHAALH